MTYFSLKRKIAVGESNTIGFERQLYALNASSCLAILVYYLRTFPFYDKNLLVQNCVAPLAQCERLLCSTLRRLSKRNFQKNILILSFGKLLCFFLLEKRKRIWLILKVMSFFICIIILLSGSFFATFFSKKVGKTISLFCI